MFYIYFKWRLAWEHDWENVPLGVCPSEKCQVDEITTPDDEIKHTNIKEESTSTWIQLDVARQLIKRHEEFTNNPQVENKCKKPNMDESLMFISEFEDKYLCTPIDWNKFKSAPEALNAYRPMNKYFDSKICSETEINIPASERTELPAFYRNSINDSGVVKRQKCL